MSDSSSPEFFNDISVVCHSCLIDFADSNVTGGIVFESFCYCPQCYHKATGAASKSHNYDSLQFPYFLESFRDFIYRLRDS